MAQIMFDVFKTQLKSLTKVCAIIFTLTIHRFTP